jgi:hypothetical protein
MKFKLQQMAVLGGAQMAHKKYSLLKINNLRFLFRAHGPLSYAEGAFCLIFPAIQ